MRGLNMTNDTVSTAAGISDLDDLCRNSIDLIKYARSLAVRNINIIELMTNYAIGRWIVEEQQNGKTGLNMEHG